MIEIPHGEILRKKAFLRPDEVAEILGISRRSVYNYYYDGRLAGVRLRKTLRITTESLLRLLAEDS
jgi:excisionase family DNA binding protein